MNPVERELLAKIDQMILNASGDELKKIQDVDLQTQMDGMSFYDAFVNSKSLVNQNIKREIRESRK